MFHNETVHNLVLSDLQPVRWFEAVQHNEFPFGTSASWLFHWHVASFCS